MNNQLVRPVGTSSVENLINGPIPPALTTGVLIRGGQGVLLRGTVLALSAENEDMVALGTEPEDDEILTANCILTDPVDATGDEAVPAVAYRAGHFNRPALIFANDYELTKKDEENLRHGGIFLSDALA